MKLVKCAFVVALILASRSSHANVIFPMGASDCKGETPADQAALRWQNINGAWGLSNIGKQGQFLSATIHCPIVKYTSNTNIGPGLNTDQLNNVSVNFNNSGDGLSSCRVDVWQMGTSSAFNQGPIYKDGQSNTHVGQGVSNIYVKNAQSFSGYWGTSTQWAYADLVCTLTIGSSIASYTVDEVGTTQGTLIFPASMGAASGGYSFNGGGKGWVESLESQGTFFNYNSQMYPNSNGTLRIMTAPSVTTAANFSCTFQGNTQISQYRGASYPGRVLTFTRADRNQTPFSCTQKLTNGTPTASGDGGVFSYKMF